MVAFRKLFPVLAIGAFLLGTATTASAQATGGNRWCVTPMLVFRQWFVPKAIPNWSVTSSWFVPVVIRARALRQLPVVLEHEHHQPFGGRRLVRSAADGRRAGCPAPEGGSHASVCRRPLRSNSRHCWPVTGRSQVPGLVPGGLFGTVLLPLVTPQLPDQTYQQGTYTFSVVSRLLPTAPQTLLSCGPVYRSFLRARTTPVRSASRTFARMPLAFRRFDELGSDARSSRSFRSRRASRWL